MKSTHGLLTISLVFLSLILFGQKTEDHKSIKAVMKRIAQSTSSDGLGADEYGKYLHAEFTRWSMKDSEEINKTDFIESVREWFDEGWRVPTREAQIVSFKVIGDMAFSRRIVTETYSGPDGESGSSKSALSETWKKENNNWLLFSVEVVPIK
jgi:hypothetical protein